MIKRELKSRGLSLKWLAVVVVAVVFVGPALAEDKPSPDEELGLSVDTHVVFNDS